MNQVTSFVISEFTNPSGEIVYRVSGSLEGKRIRKNFSTRVEALAERQVLEVQRLQAETGVRPTVTRLTEVQLHEAEAAFHRLAGHPRSLSFYLDFALINFREPDQQKPLAAAVAEYVAFKTQEQKRTLISPRQLRSIENELETLKKRFPRGPVSQFSPAALTNFFERGGPSLKTSNNRRGLLSTFFKFALQKDWIVSNPVEKTTHHRIAHRRGSADTLSAEQAMELMAHVESYQSGQLVPFFALCLFAGIRPCLRSGEILKIKAKDIRLDIGVIHIEPEVAKTREKRMVTIQPNLAAWLRAYPLDRFPIVPVNLEFTRRVVAKKLGLTHDVLRHTFISMFVAKFRSLGEAALQAGNSETIIRKHYLNLKSTTEADQFWGILPQGMAPAAVVTPFVAAPVSDSPPSMTRSQPAA
jgi:integrase